MGQLAEVKCLKCGEFFEGTFVEIAAHAFICCDCESDADFFEDEK